MPSSYMISSVEGWMVSPRKSRREIGVLLQHHDIDAGAGQQEAQHHAGRAAAGDGALGGYGSGCHA